MKRTALAWLTILAATAASTAVLAQDAAPAAPAPAEAPPAPPAPPPPAAGSTGAYVLSTIDNACIPLTKGGDAAAIAKAAGLKKSRDVWVLQLQGVNRITVQAPTVANPTVCILTVNHDIDQSKALVDALAGWSAAQNPPLTSLGAGYQVTAGVTGWSWSVDNGVLREGVVLNAQKTPDGKPIGKTYDVSTVLFSRSGG